MPANIGVAPVAAGTIRAHNAANDQRKKRADDTLKAIKKQMDGWSEAQSIDFIEVMEGHAAIDTLPDEWQDVARLFRDILNEWRDRLLTKDLLQNYLENYWPHEWLRSSLEATAIRKWLGRRPIQGPEHYRKHRVIPRFTDALEFGLKPVTWNPAEQLQRKIFEMSQSIKGRDIQTDMLRQGLYAYIAVGKPRPDVIQHWARVPEYALGVRYGKPQEGQPGIVVLGHYYAPREVVRLVENHLSPGLYGRSALYDAYKTSGNISTQFLLGWSTFHLWLTGLESIISKGSTALEAAARGELTHAAKLAAQVGPHGVIRDLIRGYKAVKEFYAQDADANSDAGIIGTIIQGGGGFGWSQFEHEDAPAKFMTNIRQLLGAARRLDVLGAGKKVPKTLLTGALAAWEFPTGVIMNHWVPYLKVSAFLDMAEMELTRLGPEATLAEKRRVFGEAWDAVDDRFGQLRYDNLFWDNTFKQLLTGGFLSVGWQVGSLRHGLGALGQIGRVKENMQALAAGGGGRPPGPPGLATRTPWFGPEGEPNPEERVLQPWLVRNLAWLITGAVIVGFLGALWQYLHTGKRPESVNDLFNPRNGKIGPSGREERDQPISYAKDYYSWLHHPVTTLEHKLKPVLSMLWEMVENEDFFGNEIRNEEDPVVQQVADEFWYVVKRHYPISATNAIERAGTGASKLELLKEWLHINAVPFTPAPAELERSDAENYLHTLMPPVHRTQIQAAQAEAKRTMREAFKKGDTAAAQKAIETAGLSTRSVNATMRADARGNLATAFQRTDIVQAIRAYTLATPEERTMLLPLFQKKASSLILQVPPPEREAVAARVWKALDLPTSTTTASTAGAPTAAGGRR